MLYPAMSKTVLRLGLNNAGDGKGLSHLIKGISPHSITHLKVLLDSLENTYKIAVHLIFKSPVFSSQTLFQPRHISAPDGGDREGRPQFSKCREHPAQRVLTQFVCSHSTF